MRMRSRLCRVSNWSKRGHRDRPRLPANIFHHLRRISRPPASFPVPLSAAFPNDLITIYLISSLARGIPFRQGRWQSDRVDRGRSHCRTHPQDETPSSQELAVFPPSTTSHRGYRPHYIIYRGRDGTPPRLAAGFQHLPSHLPSNEHRNRAVAEGEFRVE